MSDRGFWDDNLQSLQQSYWENWSRLNRKASGVEFLSDKNPWEMAQEHWWQAVSPAASDTTKVFMGRMMEQGKQFFRLAGLFAESSQQGRKAPDWNQVLDAISASLKSGSGAGLESEQLQRMMGFWELPLDSWQRTASLLSILPGDLFSSVSRDGSAAGERLFSVPGLGYSGEEQEKLLELMRLIREYQRALQAYSHFFNRIAHESIDRLREKLTQLAAEGELIDSARSLYDTWVESCEKVYGEHVASSEYAGINGRLINASMAVKHQMAKLVDEKLGTLNMPTRREIRTLQSRMQDHRRQNRRLQTELESLQEQVSGLLAAKSNIRAAPARSRRKTVPRKKGTSDN